MLLPFSYMEFNELTKDRHLPRFLDASQVVEDAQQDV
jgi:hypothetical protein